MDQTYEKVSGVWIVKELLEMREGTAQGKPRLSGSDRGLCDRHFMCTV